MEVSAEAKRIMVVALGKLYSSRTQRGGLRLHRSLLLTLVMKSARDIYHAAQAAAEPRREQQHPAAEMMTTEPTGAPDLQASPPSRTLPEEKVACASTETRKSAENKENRCPAAQHTRKRRGKTAAEPDFLPRKKAKLEPGSCPQQPLVVNSVLVDYVKCGSELGNAIPLHRAIAAC
uniref:Immediate early response 2b n=1 Tax=Amphiprion percula TaxID=161767 RepID=A0A3P8SE31_AMPPE